MAFSNIDYFNLIGGVDSRITYQSDKKIQFWDDAKNFEVDGKAVRRMKGCTNILSSDFSGQITAMGEHEIYNGFHSRVVTTEGKYYRFDEENGSSAAVKTGLTTNINSEPWMTQYLDKMVVLTGHDDPFMDDGQNITQTGFFTAKSVYGTCAVEFKGRLFIADGNTLYWSAVGLPTDWTTANDAGFDGNFNGNIKALLKYSDYIVIFTSQDIFFWSGEKPENFQKVQFSKTGIQSKFAVTKYEEKIFVFTQEGLFQLDQLGDLAQINIKDPLSYKIVDALADDLDLNRMSDIKIVSYEKKKQIWCYIPVKKEAGLYKCWIANFINKDQKVISFYPREGNLITEAKSLKGQIYTGTSDGKIYQEDKGETFDGTIIDWNIKITFDLTDKNKEKVTEYLKLQTGAAVYNNFTLSFRYNEKYYKSTDKDIVVTTVYGIWDISNWDESYFASAQDRIKKVINLNKRFTTIQLEFSGNTAGTNLYLHGLSFIGVQKTKNV